MNWQPQFDAHSSEQERLVQAFCLEIAGERDKPGSPPDPVRLLEMAQALYEAERADGGPSPATGQPQRLDRLAKADTVALWHAVDSYALMVREMRTMDVSEKVRQAEQAKVLAAKRALRKVNAIRKADGGRKAPQPPRIPE